MRINTEHSPTETTDGARRIFTFGDLPKKATIFLNFSLQRAPEDYTVNGSQIVFHNAPVGGSLITGIW